MGYADPQSIPAAEAPAPARRLTVAWAGALAVFLAIGAVALTLQSWAATTQAGSKQAAMPGAAAVTPLAPGTKVKRKKFMGALKVYKCMRDWDCGGAGTCVLPAGKCDCDAAYTGPSCTELALMPTTIDSGLRRDDRASWGGSVVKAGNKFHMYASDMFNGCGLASWMSASQIIHAVADDAIGPYHVVDVVKERFAHNPTVHKMADGTYVIYHIDTNDVKLHDITQEDCSGVKDFPTAYVSSKVQLSALHGGKVAEVLEAVKRGAPVPADVALNTAEKEHDSDLTPIRRQLKHAHPEDSVSPKMLYSDSPDGPWKYLNTDTTRKCNNPAAETHGSDGSVLLYCKYGGVPHFHYGIFKAASWRGPYVFQKMISLMIQGEDAYVWHSKKRDAYHMLYHTVPNKRVAMAWSKNGIDNWRVNLLGKAAFNKTIPTGGDTAIQTTARERHQLLINEEGEPTTLFNGVGVGGKGYTYTAASPIRQDKSQRLPSDV